MIIIKNMYYNSFLVELFNYWNHLVVIMQSYGLILFGVIFSVGFLSIAYAECEKCTTFFHVSDSMRQHILLSDEYFLVYETDENQIIPIDGGVLYDSKWQIFNMTSIKVRQFDNGNAGWIEEGKLENTDNQFWFNWNFVINDTGIVTGVWIYDGETLTEITDYNTYKTRLLL